MTREELQKAFKADKAVDKKPKSLSRKDLVKVEFKDQPYSPVPDQVEKSFMETVSQDFSKRVSNVTDYVGRVFSEQPSINPLERPDVTSIAKVALGQSAGFVMDFTGELVMEGIDLFLPDSLEDSIKQKTVEAINYISQNPTAQAGLEVLDKGEEAYKEWKKKNPNSATELESVVNLGVFFTPNAARKTLAPVVKPKDPVVTQLGEAATAQIKKLEDVMRLSGEKALDAKKAKKAYELVMPVRIEEGRLKDATAPSMFRKAKIEPNVQEAKTIAHISNIINPSKSDIYNFNLVLKNNEKEAAMLRGVLGAKRSVVIPRNKMQGYINKALDDVMKEPLAQTADMQRVIGRMKEDIAGIVAKSDENPIGALDLRQNIDKYLEEKFKFFSKDQPVVLDSAGRKARQSINDLLNDSINDDFVKNSLEKQHLNFLALKEMEKKAIKQTDSVISNTLSNIKRVLGDEVSATRLGAYSLAGASGFAVAMSVMPVITAVTGATVGGVIVAKGVMSPKTRKGIAELLALTNKAIKTSTSPQMQKELRVGRSTLLELMKYPVEGDSQEEESQQP